jgi:hypothetical protein
MEFAICINGLKKSGAIVYLVFTMLNPMKKDLVHLVNFTKEQRRRYYISLRRKK